MAKRISLGPVFAFEWLAVSRRWQWYAARSVFVLGILSALVVVWCGRAARHPASTVQAQAEVGRLICGAIIATQLAVVLLAAPAATAGAICLDRARGTLAHMLVTDLSSAEIVAGKLAARMVPVLGILLCFLPIPAVASLLGGVEPATVAGAMLVTIGVAAAGCAAALALSTWGTKTHEVLLATYAGWSLWLPALPMWRGYRLVFGGAPPPTWLEKATPVWLVAAPLWLSVTLIALSLNERGAGRAVASFGNGFQAGIGLLLLSISAATALAEERVRGNLDILLATPLSTRSIVWGKWWGTFRVVPLLAICPGAVAAAWARESGRWEWVVLIVGLFLAYGAAVTSLGLALATWLHRLDFAVAINVAVLGGVTVGWFVAVVLIVPEPAVAGIAAGSPIVGIPLPTLGMKFFSAPEWQRIVGWWSVWIIIYSLVAALLACATLLTFDRCLGRVSEYPRRNEPAHGLDAGPDAVALSSGPIADQSCSLS